ncbi:MAG TPA: inositol monophosphatase family protein [Actinomycetota bacterium]|nr:inositol monophosphatase family protein [Actinomycetota bacterium]
MGAHELDRARGLAVRAALEGGRVLREAWEAGRGDGRPARQVEEKASGDYVTEVDRRSERAIGALLRAEAPHLPVVGEELGGNRADRFWLVDPLDGTTNFFHGLPVFAVSVALMEEGRPVAGAVHAPMLGLTYSAARGRGAVGDGGALHVSSRDPTTAVVATGFPFRVKDRLPQYERLLRPALRRFEDLRRPGAASMDLAWVAAGTLDGFFELGLGPWDVAAGALLIEEAGGVVTDWAGGPDYLSGDILTGNPAVHAALLELARGPGDQPLTGPTA